MHNLLNVNMLINYIITFEVIGIKIDVIKDVIVLFFLYTCSILLSVLQNIPGDKQHTQTYNKYQSCEFRKWLSLGVVVC